jgi:hypothetical protein
MDQLENQASDLRSFLANGPHGGSSISCLIKIGTSDGITDSPLSAPGDNSAHATPYANFPSSTKRKVEDDNATAAKQQRSKRNRVSRFPSLQISSAYLIALVNTHAA